jgi:rhomboid protease GluP
LEIPPALRNFLQSVGVNTTRLQWKLYEWEKRRAEPRERGLPLGLRWLSYRHKFCPNCGGLVHREDAECPSCGAAVPSLAIYRLLRAIGLVFPQGSAATTFAFIGVIFLFFLIVVLREGPSMLMTPDWGALYTYGLHHPAFVRYGDYWRMFSAGLLHYGLIHLAFNTIALIQVGPWLESELGSRRMLVLITIAQLTTAVAVQTFGPGGVGASGWLFGLIGFGLVYFHRHGRRDIRDFFVRWAVYGFLFSFFFRFNNTAHAGGFVGGMLMGMIADLTFARRQTFTWVWEKLFWPSLAVWALTIGFMFYSIFGS